MGLNYERRADFCIPEGVAVAHNGYTMSTRGLPVMYTPSPQAYGPRALGVHTYQANHSCLYGITTYNMYRGMCAHV